MQTQKGSAVILGIMVMMFFGIILAGILPASTATLNNSRIGSDLIAAQYAAEAGAKRAVAEFYQTNQKWDWIDNSSANWLNIDNVGSSQYHVTIKKENKMVKPSAPAEPGEYTIVSTGRYNDTTKVVRVNVKVDTGSSGVPGLNPSDPKSPAKYSVFAYGAIQFNGGAAINGAPVGAVGPIAGQSGSMVHPYVQNINPLPSYSTLTSILDPSRPVKSFNSNSSIYDSKKNEFTLSSSYSNCTIIINSTNTSDVLFIDKNVNLNNVTIYSNCSIQVKDNNGNSGGQNINNSLIVTAGSMSANGGPGFANTAIVTYGSFAANGGTNLNQGVIIVGGSATFNGNSNLNYSSSVAQKYFGGTSVGSPLTVTSWGSGEK